MARDSKSVVFWSRLFHQVPKALTLTPEMAAFVGRPTFESESPRAVTVSRSAERSQRFGHLSLPADGDLRVRRRRFRRSTVSSLWEPLPLAVMFNLGSPRQAASQLLNFGLILSTAFMVGGRLVVSRLSGYGALRCPDADSTSRRCGRAFPS